MKKIKINIANVSTSELAQIFSVNISEPESCQNYAAIKRIVAEVETKKSGAKVITSSAILCNSLNFLRYDDVENFYLITLRRNNAVINVHKLSTGGKTGTIVDIGVLFKKAILDNASCIAVAHNHPSGNLNPSDADKTLTNKIANTGKIMDIRLIDHIIIPGSGQSGYFSFADEGLIS